MESQDLSVYIHIPYCARACSYCNFFFSTNLTSISDTITAICKEIELLSQDFQDKRIITVYFGGGTPGLLKSSDIRSILGLLYKNARFHYHPEITIEANPDDINKEKLKEWKGIGINRISLGVQSFQDNVLQFFNRNHNAKSAYEAVKLISEIFNNYSVDLIYGVPPALKRDLKKDVEQLLAFDVPHISLYSLTVEDDTPLAHYVHSQKVKMPEPEQEEQEFSFITKTLKENSFRHYEISNFSRPGFYSLHNQTYWKNKAFIGLGPGAHNYLENRSHHVENIDAYKKNIDNKIRKLLTISEKKEDLAKDFIISGLRSKAGLNLNVLNEHYNLKSELLDKKLAFFESQGFLKIMKNKLLLSEDGWYKQDYIAEKLITAL